MKTRSKRGQAALEYIISYGWAIAAVLIMIGALMYVTGFYAKILPSVCQVDLPFACIEYKAAADGTITLGIVNGAKVDLTMLNATILCNGDELEQRSYAQVILKNNERLNATYLLFDCPVDGRRFKADILIEYTQAGEGVSHLAEGDLRTIVE